MVEVAKGVHVIRMPGLKPGSLFRYVTAIIEDDNYVNLIDCGDAGRSVMISEYLQQYVRDPLKIRSIVLTHFDADHVGAATEYKSKTKCKIYAPKFFDGKVIGGERYTREQLGKILPEYTPAELDFLLAKLGTLHYEPIQVDQSIAEGDNLPIGGGAQIISIPGHTPGHIILYLPEKSVLITGDTLEIKDGRVIPPNQNLLKNTVSIRLATQSLKKLSNLDFKVLIPSHSDSVLIGGSEALKECIRTIA